MNRSAFELSLIFLTGLILVFVLGTVPFILLVKCFSIPSAQPKMTSVWLMAFSFNILFMMSNESNLFRARAVQGVELRVES